MEITCQSVAETFMQPNSTTEDFSASLMGLVNGSHKRLWRLANILDGTAQPFLVQRDKDSCCMSIRSKNQTTNQKSQEIFKSDNVSACTCSSFHQGHMNSLSKSSYQNNTGTVDKYNVIFIRFFIFLIRKSLIFCQYAYFL